VGAVCGVLALAQVVLLIVFFSFFIFYFYLLVLCEIYICTALYSLHVSLGEWTTSGTKRFILAGSSGTTSITALDKVLNIQPKTYEYTM
jgi:hypothetical protein